MSEISEAMKVNKEEKERTASTQRKDFEDIAISRFMEDEVEGHGQSLPSLPPPYWDISTGEAQSLPTPKNSGGSNATDMKSDVSGGYEPPISDTAPLDPEIPTNYRKVAQQLLKFLTTLASISMIIHLSVQHVKVCALLQS